MKLLSVGDVFTSRLLRYATHPLDENGEPDISRLVVGQPREIGVYKTHKKPGGWEKKELVSIDVSAEDPSRGAAEFVVIATEMSGGGGDYPAGWRVEARRLHEDGSYDPKGETVTFRQSGCFNNILKDIRKTRELEMVFV